ncbi:hypothetical protein CJF12_13305 [Chryseobacterium piperi]|uniref:hypothetical protein n=1 Tax=Chryseobacterium piperi TaxID=558152 RepID=UPI000689F17B|nr:hypothetical protein [Chryseobacterium piperi]ASW75163.1 hypothetical protein CJF12_13305 [Chryseobacterium piperi]
MKKQLFFVLLLSLISLSSYAQASDSIQLGTTNKTLFIKGNQTFKYSEYKKVFSNPDALKYAKKARSKSTLGNIFGFTGGALMGAGLVKALQKDKTIYTNLGDGRAASMTYKNNYGGWALVGIGAGVTIVGIVINSGTKKQLKKAIDLENSSETKDLTYYKVGFIGNGAYLSYNF